MRSAKTRSNAGSDKARYLIPMMTALIVISTAAANPLLNLDLGRPVRELRLPLKSGVGGCPSGLITAEEIRLEPQRIGPMRLRALANPVIRDLVIVLPDDKPGDEELWPRALSQFLQFDNDSVPVRVEGIKILRSDGRKLIHARSAVFDAAEKRLEMRTAVLSSGRKGDAKIEQAWLLLDGWAAGRLVWRRARDGRTETVDMLEP